MATLRPPLRDRVLLINLRRSLTARVVHCRGCVCAWLGVPNARPAVIPVTTTLRVRRRSQSHGLAPGQTEKQRPAESPWRRVPHRRPVAAGVYIRRPSGSSRRLPVGHRPAVSSTTTHGRWVLQVRSRVVAGPPVSTDAPPFSRRRSPPARRPLSSRVDVSGPSKRRRVSCDPDTLPPLYL